MKVFTKVGRSWAWLSVGAYVAMVVAFSLFKTPEGGSFDEPMEAPTAAARVPAGEPPQAQPAAPSQVDSVERKLDQRSAAPPPQQYFAKLENLYRTDKQAALEWARAGEDWYGSSGTHTDARRAVAITALAHLGRMDEARRDVRKFIERHPDSRYRPLVQGVTGIHPRPGAPPHVTSSSSTSPSTSSSSTPSIPTDADNP